VSLLAPVIEQQFKLSRIAKLAATLPKVLRAAASMRCARLKWSHSRLSEFLPHKRAYGKPAIITYSSAVACPTSGTIDDMEMRPRKPQEQRPLQHG